MKHGILFIALIFFSGYLWAQQKNQLMAGASAAIITPPPNSFIAGDRQNRKFSGVHDDLFAKAVVISNNENTIALVTFDCIGLLYPQLLQIRDAVKKTLPDFPVDHIVMSSTHTHSGPDVVGIWGPDLTHSGVDTDYINNLVNTAAQQIIRAYKNRVAVKAFYATTIHGGDWAFNISQPGEIDRSVNVLNLVDKKKRNIATVTNFACHPTFMDAVNDQVSADYVAGYYEKMNAAQGGINMFVQGSIGGWVQPEHEPHTFEAAYKRGNGLADAVLTALKNKKQVDGSNISFASKKVEMPLANAGFRQLSQIGVIHRNFSDSVATEIAYFTIGNAAFATHPGETVPAMEFATKALMQNSGPKFVMGLSMDALGYILKPEFFDPSKKIPHSEYLCGMSVGIETMQYVMNTLKELIK